MQVITYRGPGEPGGVATSFSRLAKTTDFTWHHMPKTQAPFPPDVVEGHLKYCNLELYPSLHEQQAYYKRSDSEFYYQALNRMFREQLDPGSPVFVNDYQFAPLLQSFPSGAHYFHHSWFPGQLNSTVTVFTRMLLKADSIGFHSKRQQRNFIEAAHWISNNAALKAIRCSYVAPLGVDAEFWSDIAKPVTGTLFDVITVERCDYIKGVIDRLQAIDLLFSSRADLINKVRFLQVIPRTRQGAPTFDAYQYRVNETLERLQLKYPNSIVVITEQLSPAQVRRYYAESPAMLITSLRDGLNLTAKEWILARQNEPSALILSPWTGVAEELPRGAYCFDELTPRAIAKKIEEAYTDFATNKDALAKRQERLYECVRQNSLTKWSDALPFSISRQQVGYSKV